MQLRGDCAHIQVGGQPGLLVELVACPACSPPALRGLGAGLSAVGERGFQRSGAGL